MVTTVTSATTAPTERSIPPLISTSSIPSATSAGIVPSCSSTLRLPTLRNVLNSPFAPMSPVKRSKTATKPIHGPAGMVKEREEAGGEGEVVMVGGVRQFQSQWQSRVQVSTRQLAE